MNKVKRYIPQLVYEEIQKLNYKNKEHLYVICDMIYRSSIYKKDNKDYSNEFVDIPKYYFRDLIVDSKSLGDAFNILKSNKILLCDGVYSKMGGKALGYKFNDNLISKLITVDVEKITISKRIIKNKNERNNAVEENLHKYRDYYLSTFKIDYVNAIKYLDKWFNYSLSNINSLLCGRNLNPDWVKLVNKYNHIFMSLSAINDGNLFFKKNKTNGRIDTNLTSLKSEYKKFIVSDKELYQIDIVNSQPFILYLYLYSLLCGRNLTQNQQKELQMYGDWTSSGLFYELFTKKYFNKTGNVIERKEVKDIMFCIFYSKNGTYQKEKSIFKSIFPFIMEYIEQQKKTKHNEFAIKLQKIESKICIDKICNKLDLNDINYWTIHDAWLVDKSAVEMTKNIIYREFYDNLHRRPELKIEVI